MVMVLDRLTRLATPLVVACTLVATGVLVHREFFSSVAPVTDRTPVRVQDWPSLVSGGHVIGSRDAAVRVVVFSDYECPACRRFGLDAMPAILRQYPTDVSVTYRHWPLRYHKLAYPAARAGECAGEQGAFSQFTDAVYRKQDSLGLKSFREIAAEVQVRDIAAFDACLAVSEPVAAVENDMAVVLRTGASGTPAVFVNGWLLRDRPDSARLDSVVRTFLPPAR